jgi:outer membrane autotransporter protein
METDDDLRAAVAPSAGSAYASISADACRSLYFWAKPLYFHGDLDGDNGYSDQRENLYGGSLGAAWRRDRLTLGFSGHYLRSDVDGGYAYDAHYEGYGGMLGGAYRFDAGRIAPILSFSVGYTRYSIDQKRDTPLANWTQPGTVTRYDSKPDADVYHASLMLSNRFQQNRFAWTPEIGVDFARTRLHGFTEKARQNNPALQPYRQRVSGENVDSVQGVLGVQASVKVTDRLTLSAKARYRYEFADTKATLNYNYVEDNPFGGLRADGQNMGRSSGNVGAGARYRINDCLMIGIDYDAFLGKRYYGHQLSATLGVAF